MNRIFIFFIFVGVFLFYSKTGITNHTEADDAFEYAHMVEVDHHPWEYHPHHLIYGGFTKALYNTAKLMGYNERSYSFLLSISAFFATGTLFLFYLFCRRFYHFLPLAAGVATGLLGLSYGFWRYACEVEVVVPAGFFSLLAIYLALRFCSCKSHVIGTGFVAGVSVLFHIMNGIPAFIIIPFFYLFQRKIRSALIYLMIAGFVVFIAYLLAALFHPDQIFIHAAPPLSKEAFSVVILKGLIGFGQCLVSGNFVFGFTVVSERLIQLFPSRMLMEELYMGKQLSLFQRIVPLFSLAFLSVVVLIALMRSTVVWKKEWTNNRASALLVDPGGKAMAAAGLWFFIYMISLLVMEPGNPEVWLLGLVPFWLLVCGLVIMPLVRSNRLWIILLMFLFLGGHNYIGGINLLKNPDMDFNKNKAAWVLENSVSNDLIITAGNPVFVRYLRYYSIADVIDLNFSSPEQLTRRIEHARTTFILNDVFDYPSSMRIRFPIVAEKIDRYATELELKSLRLFENEFGGVWELVYEQSCVD